MTLCIGEKLAEFENDKKDLKEKLSAESQKCQSLKNVVHKLEIELREHASTQSGFPQSVTKQPVDETDDYVCVCVCM